MKAAPSLPLWTIAAPILAWLLFAGTKLGYGGAFLLLVAAGLMGAVYQPCTMRRWWRTA